MCSWNLTQPGEHEVSNGSFTVSSLSTSAFFNRVNNSVPSSMMVKSAVKSVSNTLLKPIFRKAETILPVTRCPVSIPKSSPNATRVAGAVSTTTNLLGS